MSKEALERIKETKKERLTSLDLSSCELTELPIELSELTWLEELQLWSNKYLSDLSLLKVFVDLKILNVRETNLRDISQLMNFKKLEHLDIGGTKINAKDLYLLKNLPNLRELKVYNLKIKKLDIITDLISLEVLNLSSNQITDINPLVSFKKLRWLWLHNTPIDNFKILEELPLLETLSLGETKVDNWEVLAYLTRLKQLWLHNTNFKDLNIIKDLKNLESLNIDNTQVSDLSPLKSLIEKGLTVGLRTFSKGISVANCPLTNPPIEIVEQGNEAILKYFAEREKSKVIKAREVKLLVLGEGGAGKTTFVRRYREGMNAIMPKEEESTHGIEVSPCTFPSDDDTPYKVNVWDFGGQEIYHATHQFFLTKRSVYILLTDTRREDTDFNYWLQIIELLSNKSPVIIVQNQKGGRIQDIDFSGLQTLYKNIIGIYSLDLKLEQKKDQDELEKLRKKIEETVCQLPHVNQEIPSNWQELRQSLEEERKQKPYISLETYEKLAAQHNLDNPAFVSQFFHDLGVFLHFQEDAILKHRIFLNNQWVTDGVYKVLDDETVIHKQGRFNLDDIKRILGTDGTYSKMHQEMLRLMSKFELSYKIPDITEEEYLAPQLLSKRQPEFEWNEVNNLQLRYGYGFMPKGLLSRLIVRLNMYIKNTNEEVWRTGVVFHRRNGKALVKEAFDRSNIHIQTQGVDAKEILTIVSEEMDRLHNGYQNLKVSKLVPCICRICSSNNNLNAYGFNEELNFYEYEDLMRRKERGKSTVECKYSYDDVNVLRLLDSIFVTTFFKPKAKKIFVSYSKSDKTYLDTLKKHLKPIERNGLIQQWDDNKLIPGEEWEKSLTSELMTADIVIMLISADLMATDYIWDIEMKAAIERHERGEATVVPVIIRPCAWLDTPFARFSALPEKGKAISTYTNPDEAWAFVVERIKNLSERL